MRARADTPEVLAPQPGSGTRRSAAQCRLVSAPQDGQPDVVRARFDGVRLVREVAPSPLADTTAADAAREARDVARTKAAVDGAAAADADRARSSVTSVEALAPSWLQRLISACAKPMMAVSLGAQLLFGALPAGAVQGAVLGTWSPPRTEVVSSPRGISADSIEYSRISTPGAENTLPAASVRADTVAPGPAARLLAQAAPKLERLRVEARALRDAEQALPIARNAVSTAEGQHRSGTDVLTERTAALDSLDARIDRELKGARDPVDLAILRDERASVEAEVASQRAMVTNLARESVEAGAKLCEAEAALARAERRLGVATQDLTPERARAERLLARLGVAELPWITHDRSIEALGLRPASSETERVLTLAARVEAWIARSGAAPSGAELTQLALTPNTGVDWALASLPRDVVIPAEHLPFVAPFVVDDGLPSARALQALVGRDSTHVDVRDPEMFARHPRSERAAFQALLDELDGRSGGLVGPLSAFEPLWPLVRGDSVELRGQLGNAFVVDRAQLLELSDHARAATGGLDAETLPLFALGLLGQPHQRDNVAWLEANARFEGRAGESAIAERWASFGQPETAALERLATHLGRPLTIAEVTVASGRPDLDADLAKLPRAQGLALKDVYLAANLERAIAAEPRLADRAGLEAAIAAGLGAPVDRLDRTYSEDWARARTQLELGDLQKIHLVQRALEGPEVRMQLARFVRDDLADPKTELGGVVRLVDGRATFDGQNGSGGGNNAFVAGASFDPFEALASFHFHALDAHGDRDAAGPSPGHGADLATAHALQLDGFVFTLVAKDRVNVDYFSARGVVLDLGTITLPR